MVDSFMEFAHVDEEGMFGFDFSDLSPEEMEAAFAEMIGAGAESEAEAASEG